VETLDAMAKGGSPAAAPAAKMAGVLRNLETYVSGQSDTIIDYATARCIDEPNLDCYHREHGAAAVAPPDGRKPTNALVDARRAFDDQDSNLKRNLQRRFRCREHWARRPFQNAA
jgi:hypothetical protein